MSDVEGLLRELVAAQTARAEAAERTLAVLQTQVELLQAEAMATRTRREKDASRKRNLRGESADVPRTVHGNGADPQGFPDGSPHPSLTLPNPTSSRTGVHARVQEALPAEYHGSLEQLLALVDFPTEWLCEMGAMLDGMAGHHFAAPEQLGAGIRDWLANGAGKSPSLRRFRRFVAGSVAEAREPGDGADRAAQGDLRGTAILLLAQIRQRRADAAWMRELEPAAQAALDAVGGVGRLRATSEASWGYLATQFAGAYVAALAAQASGTWTAPALAEVIAATAPVPPENVEREKDYSTARLAAGRGWAELHPEEAAEIRNATKASADAMRSAPLLLELTLAGLYAEAAGFPPYERWEARAA